MCGAVKNREGKREASSFLVKKMTPGEEKAGGWEHHEGKFGRKTIWLDWELAEVRKDSAVEAVGKARMDTIEETTWSHEEPVEVSQ